MLARGATALVPQTHALSTNFDNPQPTSLGSENELHRRWYEHVGELLSDTVTITVAPDPTCGFDENGYDLTCYGSTRCSWEADTISAIFCGLEDITTACFDRSEARDTDICDSDCASNTIYNKFCTYSDEPYCQPMQLGVGMTTWECGSSSLKRYYTSRRPKVTRYFSTIVLVDRVPITTWVNIFIAPPDDFISIPPTIPPLGGVATAQPTDDPPGPGGVNIGAIVGGVVGGVAVICLTILGALMIVRRNRNQAAPQESLPASTAQSKPPDTTTVTGAPAVIQPYSPASTTSPVQPHDAGMPLPGAYSAPNVPVITTSGHINTSAHELGV
ncbi:hypothetical protein CDV36_002265 [Fusarium kuroshium]|uniref:Uncharacterized protein n=1 Tax=Fusarium kuroshium TaxID=2010991 RepID=A0A3M2SLE3_9HYPO|nr:hypothetical protein CDV36_002265 [Fusarium kuroshium]